MKGDRLKFEDKLMNDITDKQKVYDRLVKSCSKPLSQIPV